MDLTFKDITNEAAGGMPSPPVSPEAPAAFVPPQPQPERKPLSGRPKKGRDKYGDLLPGWQLVNGKPEPVGGSGTRAEQAPPGNSPGPGPGKPVESSLEGEAAQLGAKYREAPANPGTAPQPGAPSMISGYLLLLLVDAIVPEVIAFVMRRWGKRPDVKGSQMRLNDDERKQLEQLADAAAARLMAGMDPVTLFGFAVAVMYIARIPAKPDA